MKETQRAATIPAKLIRMIELKQKETILKYLILPVCKALIGVFALAIVILTMYGNWMLAAVLIVIIALSIALVFKFRKQLGLTQKLIENFCRNKEVNVRIVEVKLAEDTRGGGAGDTILIEMSPGELDEIWVAFMDLAVKVDSYSDQTKYRKLKEFFHEAYKKWEKADTLRTHQIATQGPKE